MTIAKMSDDEALIRRPGAWVQYPFLPLINREKRTIDGMPDVAFMFAPDLERKIPQYKLYHGNLFELFEAMKEWMENCSTVTFKSIQDLLDKSWEVD